MQLLKKLMQIASAAVKWKIMKIVDVCRTGK